MDKVLYGLSDFASAYLDDVVVYSNSWEEHLEHLRTVFECLHKAGLTINPAKCTLARIPQLRHWEWGHQTPGSEGPGYSILSCTPDQNSAEVIPGHVRLVPQVHT